VPVPDLPKTPLAIQLFGPLEARVNGVPLPRLRSRKGLWLLALLTLRHGKEVERDWLAGTLWPESGQSQAYHCLRMTLSDLRRALGAEACRLQSPTSHTRFLDLAAAEVDVLAFDAAISQGDEASLERAVALYRGPLLEGCAEEWAFQERQTRELTYLAALEELAALALARGDAAAAERCLRLAVAADPLRESAQRSLMEALAAGGNYAAALLVYRELRLRLHRELNTEPDPETHTLFQRLREKAREKASTRRLARSTGYPPPARVAAGDPNGSNGHAPVASRELVLGEEVRRGEGGPATESVTSLGADGEGGRTIGAEHREAMGEAVAVPHNLPLHLTRFFGREAELAQLGAPMDSRLVTLTGPGGSGKTRLALEVARALCGGRARAEQGGAGAHRGDPGLRLAGAVCFAALADLTDPRLLPERIRDALGLARVAEDEPLEQVVAFLFSRATETQPFLLLLDNFEQLLAAPPDPGAPATSDGAAVVWRLLERVDRLRVLVTSRQRLGLPGEREFPVAPLPVPNLPTPTPTRNRSEQEHEQEHEQDFPTALIQCPSVQLFLDRAQAVRPDFQLTAGNAAAVAGLCRRLEGLPLAIELASARAGVLTLQQMHSRLEQRFELLVGRQRSGDPRHRSLRAALSWSYQLLAPEMQQFFAQLSVFRGGWTVEAAEAVCGEPRALEYLEHLRECSLVQATETAGGGAECSEVVMRFHLLETLREYGAEQLAEEERGAVARQHAQFFLTLAETAERELAQRDQRLWLDRLEREHDNMRAALAWSMDSGELELGLRLGSALEGFWCTRGYLMEGGDRILRLLAHPAAAAPTAVRARALSVAGRLDGLQRNVSDLEAARRLHEESLAIWRALEDRAGIGRALLELGWLAVNKWDLMTARPLVEESLAIRRELGDRGEIAEAITCLAEVRRLERDLPAACVLVEESLMLWRALDDRARISSALGDLGYLTFRQGDIDRARTLIEESLTMARELDDRVGIAWAITRLGYVAHGQEEYPAARALFEQSLPLWRELGLKNGLIETLFHLAYILQHEGNYAAAYAVLEEMLGITRGTTAPMALLGNAAADLGRWEEAAAHCAQSLRICSPDRVRSWHVMAWALTGLARVAHARARPARAARLLAAVPALWAGSYASWWPNERDDFERVVSATRAQLDEAEFAAAWAEGQAMPLEQIIAEALQEAPDG